MRNKTVHGAEEAPADNKEDKMESCQSKRTYLRRCLPPLLIAAAFWFVASDVRATHTDITEPEDVRNTKHNLTINPDVKATGTTEICVFCHTPHGANPATVGLAPLWNRNIPIDTSYGVYSSPNFDASGIDAGRPKGVSLACLSCHDGTIAVDALINAPGSGGFTEANSAAGGNVSITAIDFTASGIIEASPNSSQREGFRDSSDQNTDTCSPYCGGVHDTLTGGLGAEGAQPFPNLGTTLNDDHPVGMQVPAAGFDAETHVSEDPQFSLIGANSTLDGHADDGKSVKYITKNGVVQADKRDRLRAYPSTGVSGAFYIECASCHNPHTPRVSFLRLPSALKKDDGSYFIPSSGSDLIPAYWSSTDNAAGLSWAERPNSGSAICLSCHQK